VPAVTSSSSVARCHESPRTARKRARALCLSSAPPELVEDVELVVSELVTNAVRHGLGAITMYLEVASDRVVVGVQDEGAGWPVPRQPALTAVDGRGLAMVALLAAEWGVRPAPDGGKVVWCVLTPAVSG
jgi:anti-sigma regulatory factor (Ser/Thr protein kinase)